MELTNPTEALRALDDDEKNTLRVSEGNCGNPNINIISESGLYKLTFRSNKPEAKRLTKWVTSEVLPLIRKTGSYSVPSATASDAKFRPFSRPKKAKTRLPANPSNRRD
ncbi:Phage antirepressor protein [Desulfovibrio sp. DV]|nr:Phage antirepressor protein [Desulfovibrio sp. DV]